ncbi:hypothetical protein TSAR_008355 [Trichomalopsis sarcophagae]|uniref:Uncharacterized protein n=1 Tax=Trichomalopsis sarcophagae TaxID=543379 RepID=A0A232EQM5_9HYME|nr:hypothetical protein TSAR_008355 [Trichomalopsis sarcophagae]
MNKTCIIILSILLIEGCYSTPVQRTRRQSETATEVSAEKEPSLEKLETLDSESRDKQDSLAESDGEEESKELEAVEEIVEAKLPSLPAAEEESDDEDEPAVTPKGVEELYRESKAEFEKNGKEEEAGESEKGSAASDKLKKDDELQSAVGDVAPAAGGIFSALSQMWQTLTSLGSSWEHWTRILNAFTALAGF